MDQFISSFKERNNLQSNNLEYIATHFVRSERISAFKHSTLNNYIYTSYDSIQYLFEENHIHGSIRMCLLYLFAEQGCGYCHKMNLIFQRVAKQLDYIDYLVFAQLNVDNNDIPPLISRQYQIDTIPSILMLKKENSIWKCVDKYNGMSDTESLNVWIQSKLLHSVKIEPGATFI
jgi:thioredoxin-like negative regulator of GroEL